jgi:glycosyl transferase family 25
MSHRKAWQAIYDLGERWGIVLEDDVLISPEFPHVMGSLDWAPPDADIVKFEACPKPFLLYKSHVPLSSRRLYRRKGSLVGGGGYAITRNACELLLKETENDLVMVVDKYLFNRISPVAGRLTTYVMSPALVIQQLYLPLPENEIFPTLISKTPLADRRKPKPPPIMRRIVRTVTRALRPVVQPSTIYRVVDWR